MPRSEHSVRFYRGMNGSNNVSVQPYSLADALASTLGHQDPPLEGGADRKIPRFCYFPSNARGASMVSFFECFRGGIAFPASLCAPWCNAASVCSLPRRVFHSLKYLKGQSLSTKIGATVVRDGA